MNMPPINTVAPITFPTISKKPTPVEQPATPDTTDSRPAVEQTTQKLDKTYAIEKDPPTTVLRFTDSKTKEVVLQIPSQVSINTYKDVQRFIEQQQGKS